MKTFFIFLFAVMLQLFGFAFNYVYGAEWRMPANVGLVVDTVDVAANATVYGKKFAFGGSAWRSVKIGIMDTSLVDQDTIDAGDGVRVLQEICFPTGNMFGFDSTLFDTLCGLCGDTTNIVFDNAEGLSADSLICAKTDTARMKLTSLGGDSLWVTDGYGSLVSDPAPLTRFKYIGAANIGATVLRVYNMIWVFNRIPAGRCN